jgi:TolB protein
VTRLAGLLACIALVAAGPASATFPGSNGRIVFVSQRGDCGVCIHTMAPDGSEVRAVTHHPPFASGGAWSPDGRHVAFMAGLGADLQPYATTRELWIASADGAERRTLVTELVEESEQDSHLEWSPDGTKLVYLDLPPTRFATRENVWVVNADGSGRRQLTSTAVGEQDPRWSPNGRRIAYFQHTARTAADVWVMDADGRQRRPLTRSRADERSPSWSPDGRRIAYTRFVERSGFAVYVVGSAGGPARRLARGRDPLWSPDGKLIAFHRGSAVYVVRPDGHGVRALGPGLEAAWSRDGSQLAVLRERRVVEAGRSRLVRDLVVVRPDGGARRRVFTGPDGTHDLSWSADGRLLVTAADLPHRGELYVVHADGSGASPLFAERAALDYEPAVSADGRTVAFTRRLADAGCPDCPRSRLHVAALDGAVGRAFDKRSTAQSWSPDGRRLAITDIDLDVYSLDDGRSTTIAKALHTTFRGQGTTYPVRSPAWSPDGSHIAYASNGIEVFTFGAGANRLGVGGSDLSWAPDGNTLTYTARINDFVDGVFALDVRTGTRALLVRDASQAAWSPDGAQLAFVRAVGRNAEIFVANADGSSVRRVTFNPGPDFQPDWARG